MENKIIVFPGMVLSIPNTLCATITGITYTKVFFDNGDSYKLFKVVQNLKCGKWKEIIYSHDREDTV